jgi:hypothetical protein
MKCIVYGIMADVNKYDCHLVLLMKYCILMKYSIVYGIIVDFNKYVCQHNIVY